MKKEIEIDEKLYEEFLKVEKLYTFDEMVSYLISKYIKKIYYDKIYTDYEVKN